MRGGVDWCNCYSSDDSSIIGTEIFETPYDYYLISASGNTCITYDFKEFTSVNGINTSGYKNKLIKVNNIFYYIYNNKGDNYNQVLCSTDGLNFEYIDTTLYYTENIVYSPSQNIYVANDSDTSKRTKTAILAYSTDGITWTANTEFPKIQLSLSSLAGYYRANSLIYYNDLFICSVYLNGYDNAGIYYSSNGINWTAALLGTTYMLNIANNILFAQCTSSNGTTDSSLVTILYSSDGMTYSPVTLPFTHNTTSPQDITYVEGVYYCSYYPNYKLYYSTDIINWQLCDSSFNSTDYSVMYNKGVYLAFPTIAGSNYAYNMLYSYNGTDSWVTCGSCINTYGVQFAGNKFFSINKKCTMVVSEDGITWENMLLDGVSKTITEGNNFKVMYYKGIYILGCTYGIYYSSDGINYTHTNVPTPINTCAVMTSINDLLIICGKYYSVLN